jgi:hypothetical protein
MVEVNMLGCYMAKVFLLVLCFSIVHALMVELTSHLVG